MFLSSVLEFETPSRDPPLWTAGQWRGKNIESSSGEKAEHDVIKVYNEAMTRIASLTDRKMKPLTFRLWIRWTKDVALCAKLSPQKAVKSYCKLIRNRKQTFAQIIMK